MIEHYTHVFRYGAKLHGGEQRWAFRFAIPDPEPRIGRGRPAALAIIFCAGLRNANGIIEPFWSAQDAAIIADAWKCHLNRYKGMKGVAWSHDNYEKAAGAFNLKFNECIEDYAPPQELKDFLVANDEELLKLESQAESLAWNPDVLLHDAERMVERARDGAPGAVDLNYAHAVLQWAKDFKDHMKLVAEFEAYGAGKFEIEISRYISLVERAVKCVPWHIPTKAHFRFIKWLDKYRARRKAMAALLEELKLEQTELRAFAESLPLRTEELRRQRVSISCNPTGATPTGSENGARSQSEATTDKSSPNLHNENKTS